MLGSRPEFTGLQVRKHTASYQRGWGREAMLGALLLPTPRPHLPMGLQSHWDASGSWNLGRAHPTPPQGLAPHRGMSCLCLLGLLQLPLLPAPHP